MEVESPNMFDQPEENGDRKADDGRFISDAKECFLKIKDLAANLDFNTLRELITLQKAELKEVEIDCIDDLNTLCQSLESISSNIETASELQKRLAIYGAVVPPRARTPESNRVSSKASNYSEFEPVGAGSLFMMPLSDPVAEEQSFPEDPNLTTVFEEAAPESRDGNEKDNKDESQIIPSSVPNSPEKVPEESKPEAEENQVQKDETKQETDGDDLFGHLPPKPRAYANPLSAYAERAAKTGRKNSSDSLTSPGKSDTSVYDIEITDGEKSDASNVPKNKVKKRLGVTGPTRKSSLGTKSSNAKAKTSPKDSGKKKLVIDSEDEEAEKQVKPAKKDSEKSGKPKALNGSTKSGKKGELDTDIEEDNSVHIAPQPSKKNFRKVSSPVSGRKRIASETEEAPNEQAESNKKRKQSAPNRGSVKMNGTPDAEVEETPTRTTRKSPRKLPAATEPSTTSQDTNGNKSVADSDEEDKDISQLSAKKLKKPSTKQAKKSSIVPDDEEDKKERSVSKGKGKKKSEEDAQSEAEDRSVSATAESKNEEETVEDSGSKVGKTKAAKGRPKKTVASPKAKKEEKAESSVKKPSGSKSKAKSKAESEPMEVDDEETQSIPASSEVTRNSADDTEEPFEDKKPKKNATKAEPKKRGRPAKAAKEDKPESSEKKKNGETSREREPSVAEKKPLAKRSNGKFINKTSNSPRPTTVPVNIDEDDSPVAKRGKRSLAVSMASPAKKAKRSSIAPNANKDDEDEKSERQLLICALSSVPEKERDRFKSRCKELGWAFTEEVNEDVSHVVLAAENGLVSKRSLNLLECMLRGCWILDKKWLDNCIEKKGLMPEKDFEVKGLPKMGDKNGPQLARKTYHEGRKLFDGLQFFFKKDLGKLKLTDLERLITAGGGEMLVSEPKKRGLKKSDEPFEFADADSEIAFCRQFIVEEPKDSSKVSQPLIASGCANVSPTWLLDSVECFKLLPV